MSVYKLWASGLLSALAVVLVVEPQSALAESQCEREYSCASCSQVRICRRIPGAPGGLQEVFRLSCSGSAPYCDPTRGACSATPSHECADLGAFTCMQDGVFADPADCKKYHVCENGTSHTFQCEGAGENFDGTMCGTSSCYTVNCYGKSGVKVPHPLNASTYGYCLNGKPLFMDMCPPGQRMYEDQQQCLPVCSYSGYDIADPSNCTRYYTCHKSGANYTLTSKECLAGQRFNPSTATCQTSSVHCGPSRGIVSPLVISLQVN